MSDTTQRGAPGEPHPSFPEHLPPVWPSNPDVVRLSDAPTILFTAFPDTAAYHTPLIQRMLALEQDERFAHRMEIGGSKIRDIHRWALPEAEFIHQRAIAFFARAVGQAHVKMEQCWGNISRKGEYLSPHSHDASLASIVYCVSPGDPSANPLDGRLALADPRLPHCCPRQEGCVTRELWPDMHAGAMVLFPAELVHHVHPYHGTAPRLTLAWNFSL